MASERLPPEHPDAPKYWMFETSGVLEPVIRAYLQGDDLNKRQVDLMRAYLYQWVSAPVWGAPGGILEAVCLQVSVIACTQDIDAAISAMVTLGIDPL